MKKKRRDSLRDTLDEAREVAAGLRTVPVERLIALIGMVNPSGRRLPAAQERARYDLKSALQSHLIEQHAAHVDAVNDPTRRDVVLLVHRILGKDAGHTILSDLTPAARRALEPADDAEPEAGGRSTPAESGETDAVQLGHAALDAFDYEGAEAAFRAAVAAGIDGGLEGLVQTLGNLGRDAEVLELVRSLGSPPLEVAVRAAESAVYAGDLDLAEHLLGEHRSGIGGAGVWRQVAAAALRGGDLERASRALSRARDGDPAHTDLLGLEQRLEAARAERRGPARRAVEKALSAGDLETAKSRLRALVSEHGESRFSTGMREELHRRERRARGEDLAEAAQAAEAAGDLVEAARLLDQAAELEVAGAREQARELRNRARAAADARRLEVAREALAAGLLTGLQGAAKLPRRLRTVLAADHEAVGWVSTLVDDGHDPAAVVEAAMAFTAVRGTTDGTELAAALEPHADVLAALPAARPALAAVQSWRRDQMEARCDALLASAGEALDGGRIEEARAAYDDARALQRTDRALEARLLGAEAERDAIARFEALLEAEPVEAKRFASGMAADGATGWSARAARAADRIRAVFGVRQIGPEGIEANTVPALPAARPPPWWISGDGAALWLVECWLEQVILVRLEVRSGRSTGGWLLRVPVQSRFAPHTVTGDIVWVPFPEAKRLLGFDTASGEVVAWTDLGRVVQREVTGVHVGGGLAWVTTAPPKRGRNEDADAVAVDIATGARQQTTRKTRPSVLPGDPCRVVGLRARAGGRALEVTTLGGDEEHVIGRFERINTSGPLPAPDGAVLLPCEPAERTPFTPERGMERLQLHLLRPDRSPVQIEARPPVSAPTVWLATAPSEGLLFAALEGDGDEVSLRAYRFVGADASMLWAVQTPRGRLVTDSAGEHVCWVLSRIGGGFALHPLGAHAPVLSDPEAIPEPEIAALLVPGARVIVHNRQAHEAEGERPQAPADDAEATDPQRVLAFAQRATAAGRPELAEAWFDAARRTLEPMACLVVAEAVMLGRRWPRTELLARLEAVDVQADERSSLYRAAPELAMLRPYHHLLGCARAMLGDPRGARAAWNAAKAYPGAQDIDRNLAVLDVVASPNRPWRGPLEVAAIVVRAVREASELLESGRSSGALSTLSSQAVCSVVELQSRALRARAALRAADAPPVARLRALASWCAIEESDGPLAELPVKGALDWPELGALATEARTWLAGDR